MDLWMGTAFGIGLVGSLHCIGMCGPITLALPTGEQSKLKFFITRVLYNLGRIITYAFMGLISGLIGKGVVMSGYQNIISIIAGVLILLIIFLPSKYGAKLFPFKFFDRFKNSVKKIWGKLFSKSGYSSLLLIGLLNGFLPCGLVYMALAGAAVTGTMTGGFMYMVWFGLGTFPVMLAMTLVGQFITVGVKRFFNKMIPVGGVILAILIILRGLSLGIPYVSPKVTMGMNQETKVECCHPAETTDEPEVQDGK